MQCQSKHFMQKLRCAKKVPVEHFVKHETKQHVLLKFLAVLVILLAYFVFAAMKYGIQSGFMVTLLTWSFFVLCTPIADAGFLIDFPLRLITKLRMFISELIVWLFAIGLNLYAYFVSPQFYNETALLSLFKHILDQPFPFWGIILISMIGTFVSIRFGDELIDKVKHKDREFFHKHKYNYRLLIMAFIFIISLLLYDYLIKGLGVDFSTA